MTDLSRFPGRPWRWQYGDISEASILASTADSDLEAGILWVGRPPQPETDPRRMDQDTFLHWLATASPDDLDRFAYQPQFPWDAVIATASLSLAFFGLWMQSWALWLSIIPAVPFLLSSHFDPPPHE